jgi:hypothetical protein
MTGSVDSAIPYVSMNFLASTLVCPLCQNKKSVLHNVWIAYAPIDNKSNQNDNGRTLTSLGHVSLFKILDENSR